MDLDIATIESPTQGGQNSVRNKMLQMATSFANSSEENSKDKQNDKDVKMLPHDCFLDSVDLPEHALHEDSELRRCFRGEKLREAQTLLRLQTVFEGAVVFSIMKDGREYVIAAGNPEEDSEIKEMLDRYHSEHEQTRDWMLTDVTTNYRV